MTGTEPLAVVIDGVRAVVWTTADGTLCAARDVCPHRRAPLSAGRVVDGELHCAYHGWSYDGTGRCTLVPAVGPGGRVPGRARLELLEVPDALVAAAPLEDLGPSTAADGPLWLDGDTPGLDAFWHPVARLEEVTAGRATVELLGETWDVERDAAGTWTAATPGRTAAWGAQAHLGHLWLAPRAPRAPLPDVAEWEAAGWHHRTVTRAQGRLGVGLLLDNQLDAGHFPFVHAGTFGSPDGALAGPAEIDRSDTVITQVMRVPITGANDTRALAGRRDLAQHRTMRYEFHAPLWLRLQLDYEDMGGSTVILFAFTPLAAGRSRMDVDFLFWHPDGFTPEQVDERIAFEERVVAEDLRLQRRFEDVRLPLDPTVEVHTRADRYSLQCRQLLRELLTDDRS